MSDIADKREVLAWQRLVLALSSTDMVFEKGSSPCVRGVAKWQSRTELTAGRTSRQKYRTVWPEPDLGRRYHLYRSSYNQNKCCSFEAVPPMKHGCLRRVA